MAAVTPDRATAWRAGQPGQGRPRRDRPWPPPRPLFGVRHRILGGLTIAEATEALGFINRAADAFTTAVADVKPRRRSHHGPAGDLYCRGDRP